MPVTRDLGAGDRETILKWLNTTDYNGVHPPSYWAETEVEVELELQFATIGEFYDAIKKQIEKLGLSIFVKKCASTGYFPYQRSCFPSTARKSPVVSTSSS